MLKKKNISPSDECVGCGKIFTLRTLNKYNGTMCCKCFRKTPGGELARPLKHPLWVEHYGNVYFATCKMCSIHEITITTCHISHNIAKSLGGPNTADNLMPIYQACNLTQGLRTFNDIKMPPSETRIELDKTKAELDKTRIELDKTKAELDKTRTRLITLLQSLLLKNS